MAVAVLNFISDDFVLTERVRFYLKRHTKTTCIVSDGPIQKPVPDLYICPVDLIEPCFTENESTINIIPVIGYGPGAKLRYAFSVGCSDYLKEPWTPEELWIRSKRTIPFGTLRFPWGIIFFTPNSVWDAYRSVTLNHYEYTIFRILASRRGEIIPRDAFSYILWGQPTNGSRAIDMHISNIRKKLSPLLPRGKRLILSVRNKGYLIS